jgi:hypothetical protein
MSFAILGANAALVPNRVRIAKANNTRVVSTVTVAVRPTFPALDASPISIPIPSRVVRSISRSARLRTARAARDAGLDGGSRALFLDRPETDVARAIFISLSSCLGSHTSKETNRNPTLRLFREKARPA